MKPDELKEIQDRIEQAKADKSKAEGAMESILKRWKEDFGCDSIEDVIAHVRELKETVHDLIEKYEGYIEELRKLIDD